MLRTDMTYSQTGSKEVNIVLGGFNANVGNKRTDDAVGNCSLEVRNERG